MGRAPCCDKANVKKGPWSPEEDAKLKSYIDENGTGNNWIALPQKVGLKRCGKSCRLRWLNYLRPNIKHGGFSEEEDNIICSLYISIGSRWSIIAAQLPGRTDNDIKNYWNTRLKKKLLGRRKDSHARRISSLSQDPMNDQNGLEDGNSYSNTLSNSALERLQLHMQLQNLQSSPFSFYNNPALWPKLHPLGEKMAQDNHHNLNENLPLVPTSTPPPPQLLPREKAMVSEQVPTSSRANSVSSNQSQDEIVNSSNGLSPFDQMEMSMMSKSNGIEQMNMFQSVFGLEAELNELVNYRKTSVENAKVQTTVEEFDCFRGMDGTSTTANESMIWWGSNDFDTKSSSSNNSWDSASVFQNDQGLMFQDYVLSYDDL